MYTLPSSFPLLFPTDLGTAVRVQVMKLAEGQITSGVRDLSSGPSSGATERALHIMRAISAAVELLVWAVNEDTGMWYYLFGNLIPSLIPSFYRLQYENFPAFLHAIEKRLFWGRLLVWYVLTDYEVVLGVHRFRTNRWFRG